LTITARDAPEKRSKRKGIMLTARVHPGESNSSWIMMESSMVIIDVLLPDVILIEDGNILQK
jgi:hypothetical protein